MYLNVTGSQPAAGLAGPRYIALPTIITPRAVVRGMGVLMLRSRGVGRGLRGFGDAANLTGLVSSYANSFTYGLPSDVEHGTAATPDVVAQTLTAPAQLAAMAR